MQKKEINFLKRKTKEIRKKVLTMLCKARSGHTGGSLSCVEILVSLYYKIMRHDPKNPQWEDRDRFILSKGHAAPTLYAVLADLGYFDEKLLDSLRKLGSPLQGHPMTKVPGIEVPTGSLGHGLSMANGMAIAGRIDKKDYHVYCLLGDGELQEGEVWEAAMTAGHRRLSNLVAIVDNNDQQLDGFIRDVKNIYPIEDKFRAFGWNAVSVNGHEFPGLLSALQMAKEERERPTVIIAKTVKGKGVSFMENNLEFHGRAPTEEELKWALMELG